MFNKLWKVAACGQPTLDKKGREQKVSFDWIFKEFEMMLALLMPWQQEGERFTWDVACALSHGL